MAENTCNDEKPYDEDLRTKKPITSSNQERATVKDNIKDIVACVNKAREAQGTAAHNMEKASNWLNKSQELLEEVLAAISAEDTPKETPSSNPDVVVDHVDTNVNGLNPDTDPEQSRTPNNYKEAEKHNILGPEQLKTEVKLFPAKPKKVEKASVSLSYAGITVEGNPDDVVACIDNAKKAFAEKDLEKAKNWLIKSQRMHYTVNAQGLLNQVLDAIAARDALKETPNVNNNAGSDDDDTNTIVNSNPEQARTRTPSEPPSEPTVHNDNVGAKKCIDIANKAFKTGDFDTAERLLLKAKRMDASIDVEQYLKHVHDSKSRDITSRENAFPEEGTRVPEPPEQTNHNNDEANTYLAVAENAFNDKRYERALQFLDKSEALITSERAVKLRNKVQDAMSNQKKNVKSFNSYFMNKKTSKPSRKEELDELISVIKNDIDVGNLDEAQRKLQTPGFGKATQLRKLRIEVEEKKALRKREDKPKTAQSNPKPVEQVEASRNEELNNIDEADTSINSAKNAHKNGDLDKPERFLRQAKRLYPTERAKKALKEEEKKRLETTESVINNKVEKLISDGLHAMEKWNYYSAELAFKRAMNLQPCRSTYIDSLLKDVQIKIKNRNAVVGIRTLSISESTEGTSMETLNRQNENPANDSDPIAAANKYADWAQTAYDFGNIKNAESFLKLAETYNTTERSRNLLVMILRMKHGVKTDVSDDDDDNTFVVVQYTRRKKTFNEGTIEGKGYVRSAEDAFIKGEFKVAKGLITKREVSSTPYVTELTERIQNALTRVTRSSHWYEKLLLNLELPLK